MMSAPQLTPTVWSLALALLALAGTTDGAITCEAVTTRYESTVTCFFGTDIFDSKHSFNLQFYYPDLKAKPETPLICNWVTAEDMSCKESPGVVYDRVLADQMTVKGPTDPRRVGGKYVCQVLPPMGGAVKPCNLTFRDVTTTTTATYTQSNVLEDLRDKVTTSLILSGLMLTVTLIILIAVLFIVCTRVKLAGRISTWKMWKKKEPDGEKPEEMTDAGKTERIPEKEPLLSSPSDAEEVNEVKMERGKEAGLTLVKEVPVLSSLEAGPPAVSQTKGSQPEGEAVVVMGSQRPEPPGIEDDHPEVAQTGEVNLQPEKKRSWWQRWRSSSSSAPKAQPGDPNSTGTGDPPEVKTAKKGKSSGRQNKKSNQSKEGEGGKELPPGLEDTQQLTSTVDGREEARRQHNK